MQNPFIAEPHWGGGYTIGFRVPNGSSEPLWWCGQGFRNLQRVRLAPVEYATREAAETAIRTQLLDFIRQYRADQAHLIKGW